LATPRAATSTAKRAHYVVHSFHSNRNVSLISGCFGIPAFEEFMKPAIETPGGVSSDPYQKTVCCLRCEQKLQRYQLMRASLAPGNAGHAILSCPRCGHVEFVSDSSPLLQSLELVSIDTGDGD
jgi:hypothetical protein